MIGTPKEITLMNNLNQMSLLVFDDADITATSQIVRQMVDRLPTTCQIVTLSKLPLENHIKSDLASLNLPFTTIHVSVTDPCHQVIHTYMEYSCYAEKISYIVAICEELQMRGKKAFLFSVSHY